MAPQSYYVGGKIRAADFNGFINDINEIVGTGVGDSGYGQDHLVMPQITAGTKIRASHWDLLLNAITVAARHQGTTINIPTSTVDPLFPGPKKIIKLIPDLENDILSVRNNKLNSSSAYMTVETNKISSSKTYVDPVSTGDHWTDTVFYEFKTTFTDSDHRRHFFNAGGELRIDPFLTNINGSHTQSINWQTMLDRIGVIKFTHNTTESSLGVGTGANGGFTNLTTSYQLMYSRGGSAAYASNMIKIYARLSGTNGIDIKVEFLDAHTNTWTDYVEGTLTVQIDQYRADDTTTDGVVVASPTYSHISEL